MRRSIDPIAIGGWLCLVATLALASPGVRVVRADDALLSQVPEGPVCSASGHASLTGNEVADFLEQWRAKAEEAAASDPQEGAADAPIALNNRGYNYGKPSGAEIDNILQQIRVEQRERQHR